jgi:hypothetical protein
MELTTVLAILLQSWRVLYPNKNDFEGGGVVAGRPAVVHRPA